MKSTGNDLIALNAVDPLRTVLPNFYSKFIIPPERELYEQSSAMKTVSFCAFVWLLWSVKESAYKYFKRLQPELIFSPSKFVVESIASGDDYLSGVVSFQGLALFYRSWLTEKYIHTIVDDQESFEGVYYQANQIEKTDSESQSVAVRILALTKLNTFLGLDGLSISKTEAGYPVVVKNGKPLDAALSLAHHYCFVGFSFKV